MATEVSDAGGHYQWFGWTVVAGAEPDVSAGRLTETHEYFHRQLDDTTAFGGLVAVFAALAEARPEERWRGVRDRLQAMSDVVHETFAVGMSLLTTQRRLVPIEGYPIYDRYLAVIGRLVGSDRHPWVALAALRAAATACMQSSALAAAASVDPKRFQPSRLARRGRPNHRLVALVESGFAEAVGAADVTARRAHGGEDWWVGSEGVTLTPASMDDRAGQLSQELHRQLLAIAAEVLRDAGMGGVVDEHHVELERLLGRAHALVPEGFVRVGAVLESPGRELLHGGALDSQTIKLTAAPLQATLLPYGAVSGLSGEGASRHGFLSLVRPDRLRSSYRFQGVPFPEGAAVACLRSTVFEDDQRHSVLLVLVEQPEVLGESEVPIYVSLSSSAVAAAPELAAAWMRYADPSRLSLVMDTPATAALQRWCSVDGARFRTATRLVGLAGMDVRIIVGRVENGQRRSALIVIPTTEFGARWFEAATHEDPLLNARVVVDPELFEAESAQLDVLLNHLLLEEHVVGTGSWRQ